MSPDHFVDDGAKPSDSLDSIDWNTFHFPTRPGTRSTRELLAGAGAIEDGTMSDVEGTGRFAPATSSARKLAGRAVYGQRNHTGIAQVPSWAVPPTQVNSWHLDSERWILIHPGQRKKVEMLKVTSRRKLAILVDLIAFQPTDTDQAALLRGIHNAIYMAFGVGLGEMLVSGPDTWEWPMSTQTGRSGQAAANLGAGSSTGAEESVERRRMGLNGF